MPKGGVGRSTVELRVLDDGYEPARCAQNTRQLIDEGRLLCLATSARPPAWPPCRWSRRPKVPFLRPFTGADALRTPFNRQVFHVRASYHQETALIVGQLTHLGAGEGSGVPPERQLWSGGPGWREPRAGCQKLQPVAQATVERNSLDVGAAVRTILATKPDAVVQISTYASSAAFVREARKAGYGDFPQCVFCGHPGRWPTPWAKMRRGWWCRRWCLRPSSPRSNSRASFWSRSSSGAQGAAQLFQPGGLSGRACLHRGLRRAQATAGKITRDALIAGLESIQSPVAGFPVAFSPTDHSGSRFVELSMLTSDGRVRTLAWHGSPTAACNAGPPGPDTAPAHHRPPFSGERPMHTIDAITAQAASIAALRRDIHAHPELCYEEQRTAELVARQLAAWGHCGTPWAGPDRRGRHHRGARRRRQWPRRGPARRHGCAAHARVQHLCPRQPAPRQDARLRPRRPHRHAAGCRPVPGPAPRL